VGDTFRTRLVDELAAAGEPPIGDLVEASIVRGRRLVFRRRLRAGAAVLSVAVVLGLAGAGVSLVGSRSPAGPAAAVSTSPAAELVKATPAGLLELLLRLLPPGSKTSTFAGIPDNGDGIIAAQLYLQRDTWAGLVRLTIGHGELFDPAAKEPPANCRESSPRPCGQVGAIKVNPPVARPDGITYQVTTNANGCLQSASVAVQKPGGIYLLFDIDICPTRNQAPPAGLPLTPAEAVTIASDPGWGLRLDPALVAAGAERFPNLSEKLGRR